MFITLTPHIHIFKQQGHTIPENSISCSNKSIGLGIHQCLPVSALTKFVQGALDIFNG